MQQIEFKLWSMSDFLFSKMIWGDIHDLLIILCFLKCKFILHYAIMVLSFIISEIFTNNILIWLGFGYVNNYDILGLWFWKWYYIFKISCMNYEFYMCT